MTTTTKLDFPALFGPGKRDYFLVTDTDGFANLAKSVPDKTGNDRDWLGGMDYREACNAAWTGYQAGVAESDAYLSRFEDMEFGSRRWSTIDAVSGGAPNIGAYLAGSPLSMRRRTRQITEGAPLTIFCDVVSSAIVDAKDLKKRGAAVLALARMLGTARPVTVYMVGATKPRNHSETAFCMVRLDNPLDLSRAAFMLAHPAAARGLLYNLCYRAIAPYANGERGQWAYDDVEKYRKNGARLYAKAINADPLDCLFMPPVFANDEAIDNPEKWLRATLTQYGGAPVQSAA